jgi:LAO/AO transport system kinase
MTEWASKIREGDARALARAATAVENRDPAVAGTMADLARFAGQARIVGITGPPGAGKSTLVDALARELRARSKTVAIIAVDPSSRISGGAILGDRIRMQAHHADPGIFIRSVATRGAVGGLSRAPADLARLMDAAGKDYVIIETVGVGQDEVDIAGLADVTVVVLAPGMGDEIQAIKAGIMEIADVFVINKADLPGADQVASEAAEEHKPVVKTVATEGTGVAQLLAEIEGAGNPVRILGPGTVSIDHLGIAVKSLEEAVRFYESLGLHVAYRETVDSEKVDVAMLPVGESHIELLLSRDREGAVAKFLDKRGPGLHHLALRVPDLTAAAARLQAAGARLLHEPRRGAGGHLYVFVHPASTGGVLLELIQENAN